MKRRLNGEGSIRKRSDNSWEASIRIEDRRLYVYGKNRNETRDKLTQIQIDAQNNELVDESEVTVEEWMNTWIDCYTAKAKQSTKARYRQDIRCHIIPALGKTKVQELKTLTVQRFLNMCQEKKGLSEKSLKNIYLVLNKALTRAQKDGLIKKNPCADAEIPAYETPQKEMRPLKDTEVPAFLMLISGHPFEQLYFIAMFTGMRESELIGLTWDCIDWEKGTIHLYRQFKAVREKEKTYSFTTLKNKQERTFTVPTSVIIALKKVKTKQAEWKIRYGQLYCNKDNFVFTDELGQHLATRTVYNRFKAIVTQMGLPEVRLHDLRHTYATLALQNGVDIKTVSHNLGHSTVAFTMDKYAHVSMTMQKDSAAKMESFIKAL